MTIGGGSPVHTHSSVNSGGGTLQHMPPGALMNYAGAGTPEGYLECNGQNVSRTLYAALFAAIGTTWGIGDGTTTFGVPDARRRVPVGKGGAGTATLGNAVGNTGGEETHVQALGELAAHTHNWFIDSGDPTTGGARSVGTGIGDAALRDGDTEDIANATTSTGSSTGFNVIQPSFVCGVFIKT